MMILAAGRGNRLRPLTDHLPKPLVEVGGKPVIEYHLELAQRLGIKEVVINVSYLGHMIMDALGQGERWGIQIQYSVESEPLETAGGLVKARPLLGDGWFLLCNADIYHEIQMKTWLETQLQLSRAAAKLGNAAAVHLIVVPNQDGRSVGDFWLTDGYLQEQPAASGEALTYSGLGLYPVSFIDSIDQLDSADPQCQRTPFYLRRWMANKRVQGYKTLDFWCDIGTLERLAWLRSQLQSEI